MSQCIAPLMESGKTCNEIIYQCGNCGSYGCKNSKCRNMGFNGSRCIKCGEAALGYNYDPKRKK